MKKGFTMIELIGVIVILGIIFGISYPTFVKIKATNDQRAYEAQVNEIIKQSKLWSEEHMDSSLVETTPQYVTVSELYNLGYLISSEIINPITKQSMENSCVKVSVNDFNSYDYSFLETCE